MSEHSPAKWMTIGELARRTRVTPDLLRAWERRYGLLAPRRTKSNRRLYSPADAARVALMQRHLAAGLPASAAAELACEVRVTVDVGDVGDVAEHEVATALHELRRALDRYEETPAQRVLERLLAEHSRQAVIRDVLLPYLHDVGDRWSDGEVNLAQEHFTSAFFGARLMAMARGWDRGVGPRALLACPRGEQHTFGLMAFGIALHEHGWRITWLGGDTPADMVSAAATVVEPDLIVLAAVTPERFGDDGPALAALAQRWACALAGAGADHAIGTELGARLLTADPITSAAAV